MDQGLRRGVVDKLPLSSKPSTLKAWRVSEREQTTQYKSPILSKLLGAGQGFFSRSFASRRLTLGSTVLRSASLDDQSE